MKLWKIDMFRQGYNVAVQSGIITAPTKEDASRIAEAALGSSYADYTNVDVSAISEISSLPTGALYLRHPNA